MVLKKTVYFVVNCATKGNNIVIEFFFGAVHRLERLDHQFTSMSRAKSAQERERGEGRGAGQRERECDRESDCEIGGSK